MLPGFRFLFAAIVLSMSILIFGLGAAALLRSAHEEFASLPSRRAPAGPVFARQSEPQIPTLALLRFDPPAADNKPQDGSAAPVSETMAPVEQAQEAMPAEPEKLAALKPDEPMPVEATTPIAPAEAAPPQRHGRNQGGNDFGGLGGFSAPRSGKRQRIARRQPRRHQDRHPGWTRRHHSGDHIEYH